MNANGETYVATRPFEALDPFSAVKAAEDKIELASTLTVLYHHKEKPNWASTCLLIDIDQHVSRVYAPKINVMHKCIDLKKEKAAKSLNVLINGFSMSHPSFSKFDRAVGLHALALGSDSHENQLLNLWIALETLVPSNIGRSKISQITDGIYPFLALSYFPRLLERLVSDIFVWNRSMILKHLKNVPGTSMSQKLVRILILPEFKEKKEEFYGSFLDFYLLRNRCYAMEQFLTKPKETLKSLKVHEQRVSWHIRRIYRTRNMIVHAGRTPTYLEVLIENLHDYLDIVMSKLVDFTVEGGRINSLEQGFQLAEAKWATHAERLKTTELITEENIDRLIFSNEI